MVDSKKIEDLLFSKTCLFCKMLKKKSVLRENNLAFIIKDGFPVTQNHTLILPKRHVADYFSLTESERTAMEELLKYRRNELIKEDKSIDGFNIGVNCGKSAGQTIFHCHIHLIPRRSGDIKNPKGGVRGVIPDKMRY
jgi:ATP adenylyltransferase